MDDLLLLDLFEQAQRVHVGDNLVARLEPVQPAITCGRGFRLDREDRAVAIIGVEHVQNARFLIKHVQHRQLRALADFIVVEIMRRGDLHRAGTLLRVGVFVRHDGNATACDRMIDMLANQRRVARVILVHRHRRIAQHGFRARGRHNNIVAVFGGHLFGGFAVFIQHRHGIIKRHPISQRIGKMPESAFDLGVFHLKIRDRSLELGVPVHKALVAVDQALIVEVHEDLHHRLDHLVVRPAILAQREFFARPIATGAQTLQLVEDRAAGFFFPFPDALDERFAAHFLAGFIVSRFGHLAFHNHLRRDARMVGARLPQHTLAAHAFKSAQRILQRVVQRMPHVQHARDIGRRDNNGIRLRIRVILGLECIGFLPCFINFALFSLVVEM